MYKNNNFFLYFENSFKKKIINKNFSILYFLKNNGNIHSCIRTCYLFKIISVIKKKNHKYINSYYQNIFFVKNIFFFLLYFKKKKLIIGLSINSNIDLKKINNNINFVIFIGNETKSFIKLFYKKFDLILKIETYCKKSLNVSVVNAITLHYLL
ncbi:TrmH family RNA methyltransferase [Candidatus Carsonella ruddii]|uniref:TrmH family RNA methyltransferase n=1 Tax=Carsonella ruddii TaxID=114186 RepID=UPI003D8149CA